VPNVEDHVSKLEHMGKETVKKLHDLSAAAEVANVELNLAEEGLPRSINKGESLPVVLDELLCWVVVALAKVVREGKGALPADLVVGCPFPISG
jgi:hypothetical protein